MVKHRHVRHKENFAEAIKFHDWNAVSMKNESKMSHKSKF